MIDNLDNIFIRNWYEKNENNILAILKHATENGDNCKSYSKDDKYNQSMGYAVKQKDKDWCQELKDIYDKLK
jgi:hypothetical protein